MESGGAEANDSVRNPTLRCIAAGRRRAILAHLLDRGRPATEQALATTLAAGERDEPVTGLTAADLRGVRSELVHAHLPALSDAGLVAWDRTNGRVETTSHPALGDPRFRRLLTVEIDGLDEALSGLSHERRRVALITLRDERAPTSRTELARELLRRETGTDEPDPAAVESVAVSLHHAHLPKLADADLVEYDRETGRVAYADHPALETALGIIYEPDEHLVERFDGFLSGLGESYRQASHDVGEPAGWPHFWGDPHHG